MTITIELAGLNPAVDVAWALRALAQHNLDDIADGFASGEEDLPRFSESLWDPDGNPIGTLKIWVTL